MTSAQLKKRAHEIIDRADDSFLKMIVDLMSEYEEDEYELNANELAEIYRRSRDWRSGKIKGVSLEETVRRAREKLRNHKRKNER